MPKLKLTYFYFHGGRGEPARFALSMPRGARKRFAREAKGATGYIAALLETTAPRGVFQGRWELPLRQLD
jgi:hypothetical protein